MALISVHTIQIVAESLKIEWSEEQAQDFLTRNIVEIEARVVMAIVGIIEKLLLTQMAQNADD